jgi:hypothetical protein
MEDEFELSVFDTGNQAVAIAFARYGFDTAIERLSDLELKGLSDFHVRLSQTAGGREPKRPTAGELEKFGRDLFALVVRGGIKTIYDRLPQSHIRLQIYSNRPDIQSIPWEYIQEPNCVPGPNAFRSVVRIVPTIGVPAPEARKLDETVRMLFVYAEPPREASVDWPIIKSSIERQFSKRLPENFKLDVLEGATTDSFRKAFAGKKYDILHMVCHGQIAPNGTGNLLFQDVKGKTKEAISAVKLGNFLKNKQLRLIVLSACNTAAGDFAKEFAVVAKTLVECGIPSVVANQFEIQNSAAASFAEGFYSKLLESGDVDLATTQGRVDLHFGAEAMPDGSARIDWGIPTLYRHLGGAKAFKS